MVSLIRNIRNICLNPITELSLIDCYVGGVVNCTSKIWETHIYKQLMGVKGSTCSLTIYTEKMDSYHRKGIQSLIIDIV